MRDFVENMLEEFPVNFDKTTSPIPAIEHLFATDSSPNLDAKRAEIFHTFVVKGLLACKRARPEIHKTIGFFFTRVKTHNYI
jgi:hypothetical protein